MMVYKESTWQVDSGLRELSHDPAEKVRCCLQCEKASSLKTACSVDSY